MTLNWSLGARRVKAEGDEKKKKSDLLVLIRNADRQ